MADSNRQYSPRTSSWRSSAPAAIIGAIGGTPDFSSLSFTVNKSRFRYGDFINSVLAFLLIAAAVYFFVVVPVNSLVARFKPAADEPAPTQTCPHCLSSIPAGASRCAFCTADLDAGRPEAPAAR